MFLLLQTDIVAKKIQINDIRMIDEPTGQLQRSVNVVYNRNICLDRALDHLDRFLYKRNHAFYNNWVQTSRGCPEKVIEIPEFDINAKEFCAMYNYVGNQYALWHSKSQHCNNHLISSSCKLYWLAAPA